MKSSSDLKKEVFKKSIFFPVVPELLSLNTTCHFERK